MTTEHSSHPEPTGPNARTRGAPTGPADQQPDKLQTRVPHPARVYDYLLGGKDNFAADRALAEKIRQAVPTVAMMIRANRDWMHRATRYLVAEKKIRQILDIGTGIPTAPNLHQVAQSIAPQTRVVYVDNDPLVLAHARALMIGTPQGRCAYLDADLRYPTKILNSPVLADTFDMAQPIAVMAASMLMLLSDEDDPWAIIAALRDWMPDGSYLAISHPTADHDPTAMAAVADTTRLSGVTFVPRSRADVAGMFGDWEMVEPGLVPVLAWQPDAPVDDPDAAYYWVGVARKPDRQAIADRDRRGGTARAGTHPHPGPSDLAGTKASGTGPLSRPSPDAVRRENDTDAQP